MVEVINVKDKQIEAQELDQLIKIHANQAWSHLLESARCLKRMRDTKLYIELGYKTFEEYTVQSLNIKERQAYTYISTLEKVGESFLQSNANLGITKLALLSNISPCDRSELTDNNDIAGMTVEEVKALVAENSNKGEQIELLTENLRDVTSERDNVLSSVPELKEKISQLEKELENEKNKPIDVAVRELSDEEIAKIKSEALAKAKTALQKDINKAVSAAEKKLVEAHKKEIENIKKNNETSTENAIADYKRKLEEVDGEKFAALKKAETLEKQLSISSSAETVTFNYYFDTLQNDFDKIHTSIKVLREKKPDTADKFKTALLKYMGIIGETLEKV